MARKNTTILIIEDTHEYRLFLKTLINKKISPDIDVVEAALPSIALNYMKNNTPAMIILDMQMPEIDGLGMLRRIRNMKKLKNTPVIICTSLADENLLYKLVNLGISDYIVKTSDTDIIISKIMKCLKNIEKNTESDRPLIYSSGENNDD